MFTHLMASAPERHPFSMSAWGGLSMTLHTAVIVGIAWMTSRATVDPLEPEYGDVMFLVMPVETVEPVPEQTTEPQPPPPTEEPAPQPVVVADLPEGFQELEVPREIPLAIAPPARNAIAIRARDFSGIGIAGGVARETIPADTIVAPLAVEFVDKPPVILNAQALGRRMEALYPASYRLAGIQGQAVVQLVVDKEGRVEEEGMSIVSATHPHFGPATQELVKLLRFEPATVNGRPVRVWVRTPVDWTIR